MVEFGIRLPAGGPLASKDAMVRAARAAEELGFGAVWVHDFISWTRHMDRSHVSCGAIDVIDDDTTPIMLEAVTNLAFLAGVTSSIRIGSAILGTPYRNPVILAKQAANIDVLSDGRLTLGMGIGALRRIGLDYEVVGVPRENKYERTREYLRVMRTIWTEPEPEFSGDFIQLPRTEINPKPVQDPLPLWFGGKGDKSLDIVAELADGWIPTWLSPEVYRERTEKLQAQTEVYGRSLSDITIAKECYACIATKSDEAKDIARPTVNTFTSGFTVKTFDDALASSLIGSPEEITDLIGQYRDTGVEHFEMKFIYRSIDELIEQMTLFAQHVIPAL